MNTRVASALVATVVALSACGVDTSNVADNVSTTESSFVVSTTEAVLVNENPAENLAALHYGMLGWHSPLVVLEFTEVLDRDDRDTEVGFTFLEFSWLVPTATDDELSAIEDLEQGSMLLNDENYEAFVDALPFTALAVVLPDGTLGPFAKRGDEPGSIDAIGTGVGATRLGFYAVDAFVNPLSPFPRVDHNSCAGVRYYEQHLDPRPASEEATILAYFELLGDKPIHEHQIEPDEHLAEQLAESVDMVDPVTGQSVYADVNDVYNQLADGVDPSDIEFRQVVNVATTYENRGENEVLVWVSTSGEYLAYSSTGSGHYINDEGERVDVTSNLIELRAPSDGSDVALYVRPGDSDYTCLHSLEGASPTIVVPFDDIAGSRRAHINIDERDYVPLVIDDVVTTIE